EAEQDETPATGDTAPDDAEPDAEPDTEPEPKGKQPKELSERQQMKAMEAEYRRHEQALRRIFGDALDELAPCTHCNAVGYAPPSAVGAPRTPPAPAPAAPFPGYGPPA